MRRISIFVLLLMTAPVYAGAGSTVDEWATRFLPEAGPPIELPAYADGYDRAAAEIGAGCYRTALCTIAGIDKPDAARTIPLRARCLAALGETSDAIALLSGISDAGDLALKVELQRDTGQLSDAKATIDILRTQAGNLNRSQLLAGELFEEQGDFPSAIAAYKWFLDTPQNYLEKWQNDPGSFASADDLVTIATAIQRWANLTSAFKENQSLNDQILAMFTRAYDVLDRESIPARLAAAEFAMSHSDGETASTILEPLDASAPLNRDVLRAKTKLVLFSGDESVMHGIIDALTNVDPDSVDAELLNITTLTRAKSPAAYDRAAMLHAKHPNRLDVLGVYAGTAFNNGHQKEYEAALAEADELSPHRSDAYVQAAQIMEMAFQRDEADSLLKTAIARTPWETTPRHMLGDLYLNDGYDDKALAVLEEAKALDPYNVKTINYLRLLDDLSKYDQRVSNHFIVFSDKEADPIAADQIGAYMESTYADICHVFQYEPKTKIVIQIYPQDDQFSVRMAGVPGVENFGVSFGRVLATIAPRKGTVQGNFNFARVLRHEFVHTINLLQTHQHCPRWLTEGLAVWQEGVPFRFANVPPELYKRTMEDKLFSIRGFPLAYIRPKQPSDGEQAYQQGAYLAKYLAETYGSDSIVKLLNAYGQSMNDEQAFKTATGQPIDKIEHDWHAWMKIKLKPWGYDPATTEKVAAIEKDAEQLLKDKNYPDALKTWQSACDLQPAEMKPHQRLAFLYLQPALSDPAKAIEHLKFLHDLEFQDARYAKQITKLYKKLNDVPNTIAWAKQATYVSLYDPAAHTLLAEAYEKGGDTKQAEAEREVVAQIQLWQQKQDAKKTAAPEQP